MLLNDNLKLRLTTKMKFLNRNKIKYLVFGGLFLFVCDYLGVFKHLFESDYYSKFSYPLDVDMEEILWTLKQGQKPSIPFINEYPYRYKIKNEKKCKTPDGQEYEDVVVLFVIKSAIPNRAKRDAIRKSWGWEHRFSDVTIRRVFVLGDSMSDLPVQDEIDGEQRKHGDIVQANFIDSYYNNTIKTMMGFKWVVNNCPRAQYIMFSDDDMYISTKNLLKFIHNPLGVPLGFTRRLLTVSFAQSVVRNHSNSETLYQIPNSKTKNINKSILQQTMANRKLLRSTKNKIFDGRLFAGYVFFSSPMRHKMSKWYVSLEEYPFSKYPPYVTAGAYVVSNIALLDMYYTSLYTKHFRFDDIYLGIVAKKAGIEPLHNENFYFWKKPYSTSGYADVIASHGYDDPQQLLKIWEEQRSLGHA